ncbi:DivIVA domain-containing protein [Jatrophihabitans sp. GAS493]|uniref:DivIVA domain-containing protein n=1 Tax=Jatrophihabitans sp. GAS493 TaxID=1907575 RepID=UPI000BB73BCD|nr:DivIVA domain-containing protein [Jatrophihabitans sp. GAS493]SOD71619.1 DivIVA domain-containing protein [Jatrophihabitans sp. GAS493]
MTPSEIHYIAFRKPPLGKRGYDEDDVDDLLERLERFFRDPAGASMTADDVRKAQFRKPPIGKRGYDTGDVDDFLDQVVNEWPQVKTDQSFPGSHRSAS